MSREIKRFFLSTLGLIAVQGVVLGQPIPNNPRLPPSNTSTFQLAPATRPPSSAAVPLENPTAPVAVDSTPLTSESVQSRLKQLQLDTTLAPDVKEILVQTYEVIQAEVRSRAEEEKRVKELMALAEAAPASTSEARRKKENPPARDLISESALRSYSLQALQALLQNQQTNYQTAVDGRGKIELATTTREARRKEIPKLIAEQRGILQKLTDEVAVHPSDAVEAVVLEASALLYRAKVATATERLKKLEQELRTYDAEIELLPLRKEVYAADERYYQIRIKEINEELNKRRETKIEEEIIKAESLSDSAPPELKWLGKRLVGRAQAWLDLSKKNTAIQLEIEQAKTKQKFWEERFQIMKNRSQSRSQSGFNMLNNWNGLLLRRHRSELPDESKLQTQLDQNISRIQQTETLIIELEDWKNQNASSQMDDLSELTDEPRKINSPTFQNEPTESVAAGLVQQSDRFIAAERELVSSFTLDAASYSDNLFELTYVRQSTIDLVREYRKFIDQHILWIRSATPFSRSDARQIWPSIQWMLDFNQWRDAGFHLLTEFRRRPWEPLLVLVIFGALAIYTSTIRRQIGALGEQASRSTNIKFLPTAHTVGLTLLTATPWVLLLAYVGMRLVSSNSSQSFTNALGMGLLVAARYFFPLEVLRQICRRGGLAEKHFDWPEQITSLLRRNLRWLIDLGVPSVGIVAVLFTAGQDRFENALGRIAFATVMILLSIFLFIILRPKRGVFGPHLELHQGGWADRLRYVWYPLIACGPLMLCINSLTGYHYTAIRLSMYWHTTVISLIGLMMLSLLMRRWLLLSRRKIMADQARIRLEQAQQRDSAASASAIFNVTGSTGSEVTIGEWDEKSKQVDLAEINAQTMRLVKSSLMVIALLVVGYIWSGVLPAVNMLDTITLWSVQGDKPNEMIPITLGNLLLALPVVVLMFVAARNLPGLLEIALLQYLPIENAVRYAISTLSRYAIVFAGLMLAFYYVGGRWASIQWLVAALGVGLGFGLQEIFANFISGLILLFEQPIRVGDIITVGDTTGSVSRIQVRATTITNFDRQELIIPNKDLITGKLLNWTLSDATNRMVVTVGLAYGSDTDLACRLIQEICKEHPNILNDPPPTAHFEGFQDSALLIKVRYFLENLDNRLPTTHYVHTSIHRKFAEAGLEIAFPQRDIHLRSVPQSIVGFFKQRDEKKTPATSKVSRAGEE